jgi:hypothetical protein
MLVAILSEHYELRQHSFLGRFDPKNHKNSATLISLIDVNQTIIISKAHTYCLPPH